MAVVLLGTACWYVPTPYILRAPGRADDLAGVVSVPRGRPNPPGQLFMTTVIHEKATLFYCMYALLDPSAELVRPEQAVLRPHVIQVPPHGIEAHRAMDPMDESKRTATLAALRYLGYRVERVGAGVRVGAFFHESRAIGTLKEGDVVEGALGKRVRSTAELRTLLQDLPAGRTVAIKVRRHERLLDLRVRVIRPRDRTIIGFVAEDLYEPLELPVEVDITTHNVNGASAGLMFALAIVDRLTPGGITHGLRVAGTGTIDADGKVGAIEGIDLKQVAARRAGATVFIVPAENHGEVPHMEGMHVIPVSNLAEAVHALARGAGGR